MIRGSVSETGPPGVLYCRVRRAADALAHSLVQERLVRLPPRGVRPRHPGLRVRVPEAADEVVVAAGHLADARRIESVREHRIVERRSMRWPGLPGSGRQVIDGDLESSSRRGILIRMQLEQSLPIFFYASLTLFSCLQHKFIIGGLLSFLASLYTSLSG